MKKSFLFSVLIVVLGVAVLVAPAASAESGSITACETDPSMSFKVCIRQNYLTADKSDSGPYVAVVNYKVTVTRLDPSQLLQIHDLYVLTSVFGPCGFQCRTGFVGANKTYHIVAPINKHVYTFTPSWANEYVLVGANAWQGASGTATVSRYASSWELRDRVAQGELTGFGYPA